VVDSWGPVMTVPKEEHWLGALVGPTNNSGELSAIYHARQGILASRSPGSTDRRNFNLL